MTDIPDIFEMQAQWQTSRQALSWAEKVRPAEAVRGSLAALRWSRSGTSHPPSAAIGRFIKVFYSQRADTRFPTR
jgi:hypothetical protein